MKPKGLLIAVALLAVLGGVVWWSNKKQDAASKTAADTSTRMLTIPEDQFQEIRIKKLTGEVIDLQRAGGKWRIVKPAPLAADQDAVSSMVSTLASVNADKAIEDSAADLAPYGLHIPTLDITVTRKDGKTDELLVGDDTPTGSGAYAKVGNSPKIYTVGSMVKTSLDKRPDDLRDKRLLTFDSEKLTRVNVQAKGPAVEIGKNSSGEWQILKPSPLRADSSAVEALIGKLKDAKMDVLNPDADAARKYAAAPRSALVTVADAAGTETLEVHKAKDKDTTSYYAKSSAIEGIYKISSDVGDGLDKGVDDFRNKKLYDFGFSDPTKFEIRGVTYTKEGDKWMAGGKTMDNSTIQSLIDRLRDFSATRFVDKPVGGTVVLSATVVSSGGKRTEKVDVRKEGDNFYAQREGEPGIYEVETKSVADIQQAINDLKEAGADASKKK